MSLRSANKQVSDALFIAMVLKGLIDEYQPFIAILKQSETVHTFQKFNLALRNFEEIELIRSIDNSKSKDCYEIERSYQ